MPSSKKYNSASKYKIDKDEQKIKLPMLKGSLLLIFAFKYLATSFFALGAGESFYFLMSGAIFSLVMLSYVFLRRGSKLERIYNDAKYAKRSKYPYKTMGAISLVIATTLSAYLGDYTLIASFMLGGAVGLGWYFYYGFDPRVDKIDGYESDRSAQRIMALLKKAKEDIVLIQGYAKEINSSTITPLMQDMAEEFLKILHHIEVEPDDYDKTRKYLVSYLSELRDMSETFMRLDAKERSQDMKLRFEELLQSSIEKLQTQYDKLMDDDILDLDIKLSVMKKRFKNEG